jgi:hypothetical protein
MCASSTITSLSGGDSNHMALMDDVKHLGVTFVASLLLIGLAVIYFTIALGIVKTASELMGYTLDGNWAVFSAAILTAASMVGSSFAK